MAISAGDGRAAQAHGKYQGETVVEMNDHGRFLLSTLLLEKGLRTGGGKTIG